MEEKKNKIEQFLDLAPVEKEKQELTIPNSNSKIDDDYEFSRQMVKELLIQGYSLFNNAKEVAESSQDAKDIIATTDLLRSLIQCNEKLLDLTDKKQKISGTNPETKSVNNTMNIKITSSEFLKLIKGVQNGSEET